VIPSVEEIPQKRPLQKGTLLKAQFPWIQGAQSKREEKYYVKIVNGQVQVQRKREKPNRLEVTLELFPGKIVISSRSPT
jgi:hypothetical protein